MKLRDLASGVAVALKNIHDAGIVHRDLKPRNVLLALSGPKVIDFGIARTLTGSSQLTETGVRIGTIGYMAPEQLFGERDEVGPAADIFAWGALVVYAGTGRPPLSFEPGTDLRLSTRARVPNLHLLPNPLRGLVERALALDPDVRPKAHELCGSLLADNMTDSRAARPGTGLAVDCGEPLGNRHNQKPVRNPRSEPEARRARHSRQFDVTGDSSRKSPLRVGLAVAAAGIIVTTVAWASRPGSIYPNTDDGTTAQRITIRSDLNLKCLDRADGVLDSGPAAQLRACTSTREQTWTRERAGVLRLGEGCLDLAGKRQDDGTSAVVAPCDGTASQQWRPQAGGEVVNQWTGLCLDLTDGDLADGAPLQIWTCNGLPHQRWAFSA